MEEVLKLFKLKQYSKAQVLLQKLYIDEKNSEGLLEKYKYLYLCSKFLNDSSIEVNFNLYLEKVFESQKTENVISFIEGHAVSLTSENQLKLYEFMLREGELNKAENFIEEKAKKLLAYKNYYLLERFLTIYRQKARISFKVELIRLSLFCNLLNIENILTFLNSLEASLDKNWKRLKEEKTSKRKVLLKTCKIISNIEEKSIYIKKLYFILKYNLKQISQKEKLEYLLLTMSDSIKRSYLFNQLDIEDSNLLKKTLNNIEDHKNPNFNKKMLKTSMLIKVKKLESRSQSDPVFSSNTLNKNDDGNLRVDARSGYNENFKYYVPGDHEEKLIEKFKKSPKEIDNPNQLINILIENSFLKAAEYLLGLIEDEELRLYYKVEIKLRMEHWSEVIDIILESYKKIKNESKIIYNYYLGISYKKLENKVLALKYFQLVLKEDSHYRSIKQNISDLK